MIQLILLGILLAIVFYAVGSFLKSAPSAITPNLRKNILWIIALLLLAFAATGRLGWLIPLAGAILAALLRQAPALLKFAPLLQRLWRGRSDKRGEKGTRTTTSRISQEEALEILGLQPGCSKERIVEAHRRLMQKLHPDRGGSDYFAAKLNQARDVLLGH